MPFTQPRVLQSTQLLSRCVRGKETFHEIVVACDIRAAAIAILYEGKVDLNKTFEAGSEAMSQCAFENKQRP